MMATKNKNKEEKNEPLPLKKLRLALGIIGIIAVIVHMTYYVIRPYSMLYFFLGFGVIYLLFILPLNLINKKYAQ